ncbi:MAG: Gfo/Idh/MocA family oxidoreductase [Armatimonadetes bacterium]|nr:Gfo/Idh/MocA family oxidoreductase [Armatimonadota bacterium]
MRVGIVGCGGMGGVHANKYAQMHGVEVAVFDTDSEKLAAFVASRGLRAADSFEALLRDSDAMDVCLPTPVHADVAVACLSASKPTLVEKPFARTVAECERMITAARDSGALLVPAHVARFFPEHRTAHEAIARGDIGVPASVRMRRGGGPPKADWFLDADASGGILLDLAVHEFDWLLWTLGPAETVTSRSVRLGKTVEGAEFRGDYALSTVTFKNGCVAHVESTWMDPSGFRVTIEACGPKGVVEFDSRDNPSLRTHTGTTVNENNYAPEDDPYFRQLTAFLEAASGQAAPSVKAEEGTEAVRLATAAIQSAKTGEPVRVSG